ncbi:hypothetical protein Q4F19_09510 [Sphingomonas sp. BIUV-7]|uniref:Uncharacterized protein n=1 Tax=Sphingomonas natans TaxID=3063330 RepID=A0ABT8Y8G2_9SPHN|nr:hypothetical protein [Sphingomonas sp. BIUV-7]MDO6414616.1 hypothetical protein [Sphingomonas sp. BIUV-7]
MTEPQQPAVPRFDLPGLERHDYAALDWQPIETYERGSSFLALLIDAQRRMILGALADNGEWCEYLDGELLPKDFAPVEWAAPTSQMIQALAFG